MYVYNNGFNATTFPHIKPFMEENEFLGNWPSWYWLVSSMYGSDLAINHLIPKLSWKNKPDNLLDMDTHYKGLETWQFWQKSQNTYKIKYLKNIFKTRNWVSSSLNGGNFSINNLRDFDFHSFVVWSRSFQQFYPSLLQSGVISAAVEILFKNIRMIAFDWYFKGRQ